MIFSYKVNHSNSNSSSPDDYRPIILNQNRIPEKEFDLLQSATVQAQNLNVVNSVRGNHDQYFLIKDESKGLAHFVNRAGEAVTPSFSYASQFWAYAADTDANGADELYVQTEGYAFKTKTYAFDLSEQYDVPASALWQGLAELTVPYDPDYFGELFNGDTSGCLGEDTFFPDGPYRLTVEDGNLVLGSSVLVNNVLLTRHGEENTIKKRASTFRQDDLLDCAYQTASNDEARAQIRSAAWALRNADRYFDQMGGPLQFEAMYETFQYGGIDVEIDSVIDGDEVVAIEIAIDQRSSQPFDDNLVLRVNRTGQVYQNVYFKRARYRQTGLDTTSYFHLAPNVDSVQLALEALQSFLREFPQDRISARTYEAVTSSLEAYVRNSAIKPS